jgi:hypothetical protein
MAEALLTSFPEVRRVAVPGGTGYRGVKIRDCPLGVLKGRGKSLKEDVENWAASCLEVRGDAVTFLLGEGGLLVSYEEYMDSLYPESPADYPASEPGRDKKTLQRSTKFRHTLDAVLKALEPAVVEKIHFSGHVVYRGVGLKEAVGNGTERNSGGDATEGTLWTEEKGVLFTSREKGAENILYTEKDESQEGGDSEIPRRESVRSANGRDSGRDATDGANSKDETSVPSPGRVRRLETVETTKQGVQKEGDKVPSDGAGEVGDSRMKRKTEGEDAPLEFGSAAAVRYSETSRYGGTVGDSEKFGRIERLVGRQNLPEAVSRDADLPENEPPNDDLSNGRSGRELVGDKVSTQSEGEQLQEKIQPMPDEKEGQKAKACEGGQLTPFSLWTSLCSVLVVSFKIRCWRYLEPADSEEPSKADYLIHGSAENDGIPAIESARTIAMAAYNDAVRQAEVTSVALRAAARALAGTVADAVSTVGYLEEKMQELEEDKGAFRESKAMLEEVRELLGEEFEAVSTVGYLEEKMKELEKDTRAFRESVAILNEVRELLGEEFEEEEGVSGEKAEGPEQEEEAWEKSRVLETGAGEKVGGDTTLKWLGQNGEKEQVLVKKQEGFPEAGQGDFSWTEMGDTWPLGDALAEDRETLEEALRVAEEAPYVVQAADIALAAADLEMTGKEEAESKMAQREEAGSEMVKEKGEGLEMARGKETDVKDGKASPVQEGKVEGSVGEAGESVDRESKKSPEEGEEGASVGDDVALAEAVRVSEEAPFVVHAAGIALSAVDLKGPDGSGGTLAPSGPGGSLVEMGRGDFGEEEKSGVVVEECLEVTVTDERKKPDPHAMHLERSTAKDGGVPSEDSNNEGVTERGVLSEEDLVWAMVEMAREDAENDLEDAEEHLAEWAAARQRVRAATLEEDDVNTLLNVNVPEEQGKDGMELDGTEETLAEELLEVDRLTSFLPCMMSRERSAFERRQEYMREGGMAFKKCIERFDEKLGEDLDTLWIEAAVEEAVEEEATLQQAGALAGRLDFHEEYQLVVEEEREGHSGFDEDTGAGSDAQDSPGSRS